MKVKQAKLAQALRGESSNIIEEKNYHLEFDKGMLTARLKHNPKNLGPFIIFPANIAYIEFEDEAKASKPQDNAPESSQSPEVKITPVAKGRPKKGE